MAHWPLGLVKTRVDIGGGRHGHGIACTECGSKAPNSSGHQRRLPINLHSRTTEFPPISGNERPCRDAGVGAIAPGFAMLERAKRASHIDPPASSYAIMRRARPYRGENREPGKDDLGELDTETRN